MPRRLSLFGRLLERLRYAKRCKPVVLRVRKPGLKKYAKSVLTWVWRIPIIARSPRKNTKHESLLPRRCVAVGKEKTPRHSEAATARRSMFATAIGSRNCARRQLFVTKVENQRPCFIFSAGGGSTWPPKPLRMADNTFSAKVCSIRERNLVKRAVERTSAETPSSSAA